ncbi:MAG: PepSY-like domain-containing protein [Crocinitomicaceae bacterium]|nr:PepSY-like domain-containing protein [Crocinitomicaceae bacterium]
MKIAWFSFILLTLSLTSCDKEKVISNAQLPSEVKNFVSLHFPQNPIIHSVEAKEGFNKSYDLILEGNFNLEFNRKYQIEEIKGITALPNSVIPEKIRIYVQNNYPTMAITDWELEKKNQKIELDNQLTLEFTMQGDYLRIDN